MEGEIGREGERMKEYETVKKRKPANTPGPQELSVINNSGQKTPTKCFDDPLEVASFYKEIVFLPFFPSPVLDALL